MPQEDDDNSNDTAADPIVTLGQGLILIAILYSVSIIFFIMCIASDILIFFTKLFT